MEALYLDTMSNRDHQYNNIGHILEYVLVELSWSSEQLSE